MLVLIWELFWLLTVVPAELAAEEAVAAGLDCAKLATGKSREPKPRHNVASLLKLRFIDQPNTRTV